MTAYRKFILAIVTILSLFFGLNCKKKDHFKFGNVPSELPKKLATQSNCSCAGFSFVDDNDFDYKPAVIDYSQNIPFIYKIKIDEERRFLPQSMSSNCNLISYSAESTTLKRTDIFVYNIAKKEFKNLTKNEPLSNSNSIFSPDSVKLAWLSGKSLNVYDFNKNLINRSSAKDSISFKSVTWSSNAKYIFLEDDSTNIWKYRIADKNFRLIWRSPKTFKGLRLITASEKKDDKFYFISDFQSQYNQIYKYEDGKASIFINTDYDKFLLQRPERNGYLYYRSDEDGNYLLKRFKNGVTDVVINNGVLYDYCDINNEKGFGIYSDRFYSPSIFLFKKNVKTNLLSFIKPDTIPPPKYLRNKFGMFNLVYLPDNGNPKAWVIYLHGGPKEQTSNRYSIYISSMVKSGYGVIAINYPGSVGIGNNYEFENLPNQQLLAKQLLSIKQDIEQASRIYKIKSYSLIAVSYGTTIARPFVEENEKYISHYIELNGLGSSVYQTYKIPVLFVYGQKDPAYTTNVQRVEMIKSQLINTNSSQIVLKNEGHNIINRKNVFDAVTKITGFLND